MPSFKIDPAALEIGDIVFIRVANFLYRRVADATASWTSHVGMIHSRAGSEWLVAESAVPRSRFCPLSHFIGRSEAGRCAVLRLKTPPDAQARRRLQIEAERRMGQWYHFGFNLDARRQFCSKFVYEVYRDALGVNIGTVESFRELLQRNPTSPLIFWKIWFLGHIPWERRTITPGSQYESDLLQTICENMSMPREAPSPR
jgi:permuted papain-like amidase YaeF/Yiix C92 family enzyme